MSLDLWRFVRDGGTSEVRVRARAKSVTDGIERILQVIPPTEYDRPDLEQLFTLLDLAETGVEPVELIETDWRDLRPKLIGMIADAFQWHQYQFQPQMENSNSVPAAVIDGWASRLRKGDTIVSFNWDLLHEVALFRHGKWHYSDGYGFVSEDAPNGCRSVTQNPKTDPRRSGVI